MHADVTRVPDQRHRVMQARGSRLWLALGGVLIVFGIAVAIRSAWICDDAFITLRYIDNFERGLGLVYNQGERVEGYTHFLWLILLAAAHRTGIDILDLGRYLPIVFHAGTLALLTLWSFRRSGSAAFFPLAAAGVALNPDVQIWASSGLETAAFTTCVTGTVLAAAMSRLRPGAVATLAALATLFRPEGLLVSAAAAAIIAWRQPGALARFTAAWLALVAPLVIWRLAYYDAWVPNTYYAKSASAAYWSQGWRYCALYFWLHPIPLVSLAAGIAAVCVPRVRQRLPVIVGAVMVSVAMLVYVARVGGDFMFARFLVPITPLLYLVIEEITHGWRPLLRGAAVVLVLAATALSYVQRDRVLDAAGAKGIVDEHALYPRSAIEMRRALAAEVVPIFTGLDVRVCTLGSQACFAYFARFPYVFDRYGLTDRDFARRPLPSRGRPGHEREILRRDLIDRRVHFMFRGSAAERSGEVDEAVFGNLLASVVFYDRVLMDSLRGRPGVDCVDYPAYLDSIVNSAGTMTAESRRRAWTFARGYYFEHNTDPERFARARAALDVPVGAP
jgi:hypothetical protein